MTEQITMCSMSRNGALKAIVILLPVWVLAGCSPSYSPNSYASNAAQLAEKVDQGIVVGVRPVLISADPTLGVATAGAAGGIAGSQIGNGASGALGALGGSVAGGLIGNVVTHAAGDTDGFEYIVRRTNGDKNNGDLMSVTQKDAAPFGVGAHVLIIEGPQARIVADYTVPIVVQPLHPEAAKAEIPKAESSKPTETAAAADPPKSETASQTVATPLPPPAAAESAAPADGSPSPAVKPDDSSVAKPGGS